MTRILTLDTTSRFSSISVGENHKLLSEFNFTSFDNLSATLIPAIDFVLNNLGFKTDDIDLFGITIGPGLFTGIRVGLSTIKGLLFAGNKAVVPVITLEALACNCRQQGRKVVPLIDARRKEVYISVYNCKQDECTELLSPKLISIDNIKSEIQPGDYCFTGDGAICYKNIIKQHFPSAEFKQDSNFLAREVAILTYNRYLKGDFLTDIKDLIPFYIRKPDAQVNLEKSLPGN